MAAKTKPVRHYVSSSAPIRYPAPKPVKKSAKKKNKIH